MPRNSHNHEANADMLALCAASLELPDYDLAEGLVDGSFAADAQAIGRELGLPEEKVEKAVSLLAAYGVESDKQALLRTLRVEFTRLFVGPKAPIVSPFQGVFAIREGGSDTQPTLRIGAAAVRATNAYREVGLSAVQEESPDHMRLELLFLRELELRAAAGDPAARFGGRDFHAVAKSFVQGSFGAWAEDFFAAIEARSEESFYRAIGCLGKVYSAFYLAEFVDEDSVGA